MKLAIGLVLVFTLGALAPAQNPGFGKRTDGRPGKRVGRFEVSPKVIPWLANGRLSSSSTTPRIPLFRSDPRNPLRRRALGGNTADSIPPAWARHYGPEAEQVSSRALDLAVDRSGNSVVAGTSDNNFLTIKYNAAGSRVWIRDFHASELSNNCATSVALDEAGNIYVSGFSDGFRTDYMYDYVTIKYDASGNQQWLAHYDANATFFWGYDRVRLAVDKAGNVYITSTNSDRLIKYDAAGSLLWVTHASKRFDAFEMTIDNAGCVYITGLGTDSTSTFIVTAKYYPSGVEAWMRQFRRDYNLDAPEGIAVDDSGNVLVTGGSNEYLNGSNVITLKYDSLGNEQWVAHYDAPGPSSDYGEAVAVDHFGNVYVTGRSDNTCATIKYTPSGNQQWVAFYGGTGTQDEGSQIVLDASGNVCVAGFSRASGSTNMLDFLTIKYNASGTEQWARVYSRQDSSYTQVAAMAVDDSGSVLVAGTSMDPAMYFDCATVKYDVSGNERWVALFDAPKVSYAGAFAVAVDPQGYVYVTGGSIGIGMATLKYSPAGEQIWGASYNSGWAKAIALDAAGNVYVAGTGPYTGYLGSDYIIVKYNPNGIEQWVAHYDGTAHDYDDLRGLAVDSAGNVYVSGLSYGQYDTLNEDYATVKYNSSGVQQWAARYNGPSRTSDYALAIAVDGHGNSYVTGRSWNSDNSRDIATIKYDGSGRQMWVARYHGPEISTAEGISIVVDPGGHVYVTGSSSSQGGGLDYTTIKYDTTGAELWVKRYNGPANQDDAASAMKLDRSGNVYVTGYSQGAGSSLDYATVKYDSAGTEQWVARYNGPGNGINKAAALSVGPLGGIYVTGKSEGSGSSSAIATIRYDSAGHVRCVARFVEPDLPDGYATAIAPDANENVYVAGYSGSEEMRTGYSAYVGIANKRSKYTLLKYSAELLPVKGFSSDLLPSFRLEQNYPNPFNPSTTIRYGLPRKSAVMLTVYNCLGQLVSTLARGEEEAGLHEVKFDGTGLASGVYFYRLQAGDFVKTLPLLLLH